jgi:hypothetical protein
VEKDFQKVKTLRLGLLDEEENFLLSNHGVKSTKPSQPSQMVSFVGYESYSKD